MNPFPTYPVLGFPILDTTIDDFVSFIKSEETPPPRNRCVSFCDAHVLTEGKRNKAFGKVLQHFYGHLADGKPLVWLASMKGAKHIQRCFGPVFFEKCMRKTATTKIKHFLCGGKSNKVLHQLTETITTQFMNHKVVGSFSPDFRAVEMYDYAKIAQHINQSKADFVWIGLSTPKQQQFALHLSQYTNVRYLFAVGAAFDYHSNSKARYAPTWIQKMGMEWCFRLFMEPRRLWKRYVRVIPTFMFYATKDVLISRWV